MNNRALVADAQPITREAIQSRLIAQGLFDSVESARSIEETRSAIHEYPADLLVIDFNLGCLQVTELLTEVRENTPDVSVLVYSDGSQGERAGLAYDLGARGYVSKRAPVELFLGAVQVVMAGGVFVSPELKVDNIYGSGENGETQQRSRGEVVSERREDLFSPRQLRVFELLMLGASNRVIAEQLQMAEGTVKTHLNGIYRALRVKNRSQAILKATEMGLS